jgi:hypothetical protein
MKTSSLTPPLPFGLFETKASQRSRFSSADKTFFVITMYALAMAWVESAVVYYLRSMIDRIVPYQAIPLPKISGFAAAELVREAATMVMLATVGWLAGATWRSRFAYCLIAFGIWDIAYYIWLVPLTGWPTSITDWDILFLIPFPWWGPVWAPVSIALLMVVFGSLVSRHDSDTRPVWPGQRSLFAASAGILLALYVFMADSLRVVFTIGISGLYDLLPVWFNWPLFLIALALMAVPAWDVWRSMSRLGNPPAGELDCDKWLAHFARNRLNRPEPDWAAPVFLNWEVLARLRSSIEQFELGDGGGPASLIAFNRESFRGRSEKMRAIVDAWFQEERGHARLLGRAVDRLGGRHIKSHWSFTAFCLCRRFLGVRFEMQVLTLTELVSTAYYCVLRRHSPDRPIFDMCTLILRDEAGHTSFQRERLTADGCRPRGRFGGFWRWQFWFLGHAAATMLWINHGPCLEAIGGSRAEYFKAVRRELRRFIAALAANAAAAAPSAVLAAAPPTLDPGLS